MDEHPAMARPGVSRRTVVVGMATGAAATGLLACNRGPATSAAVAPTAATTQDATSAAGECVATAPVADANGVGLASLLVGGIVRDMPTGPVEMRISRFTLKPGTPFDATALPYPSLMYIETGASDCPGGADRLRTRRRDPGRDDRRRRPAHPDRHDPVHPGERAGRGRQQGDGVDVLDPDRVRPGPDRRHPDGLDGSSLCQVDLGQVVGSVVAGSGSDLSEEPVVGVEPAALELVVAPWCPPGPAPFGWSVSRIRHR